MELKAISCPNCGANTTNHQNCEYCGSLLVRFIDEKIEIDNEWYGKEAPVINGLIDNLKQNLQLQESHPGVMVCTDLDEPSGRVNLQFANCLPENSYGVDKIQLVVYLRMDPNDYIPFTQLPISRLFKCSYCAETGYWECCINFGKDYETAARMISHISREVYGVTNLSSFKIKTWSDKEDNSKSGCLGILMALFVSTLTGFGYAIYNLMA